jgi:phosphoenolpyruvate carboxylase
MTITGWAQRLKQYYSLQTGDGELRRDIRLLGGLLGKTIKHKHGQTLYNLVEEIRQMAKDARRGNASDTARLIKRLSELNGDQVVILARAFALFLNLANIAEQHHQIRRRRFISANPSSDAKSDTSTISFLEAEFGKLIDAGVAPEALYEHVCKLSIDLVLTAHPTEIVRRSVSSKFILINQLLAQHDRIDLSRLERDEIKLGPHRAIVEVWETDEIRRQRPTPP